MQLVNPDAYGAAFLNLPGVVGYWPADEGAGQLADRSPKANNAAPRATPLWSQSAILGRTAPKFNNSTANGFVTGANSNVGDNFTFCCLMRVAAGYTTTAGLISGDGSGTGYMRLTTGAVKLLRSNTTDMCTSTVTVNDGKDHLVIAGKAGATVKIYIDGIDRTGAVTNSTCTSGKHNFGNENGSGAPLTGFACAFGILNRLISANEARHLASLAFA